MNAEFKQRWIGALRGGAYKQTRYTLAAGGRFCCIGVGLDLLDPYSTVEMTATAADKIGLTDVQRDTLVDMNDVEEKSFTEIADYIEQNL